MKRLKPITEDEMVAIFLRCELGSPRFSDALLEQLGRDRRNRSVVESPDLHDAGQNSYRRGLLGTLRGFQQERSLFRRFPRDVRWERVLLSASELSWTEYVNYDYWVELSGGSRRPADAATRVREGVEVFRQPNSVYWNAVEALRGGAVFPPPILVTHNRKQLVVLEGHVRLTAFALEPNLWPDELEVILGSSDHMTDWPLY